MYGMTGRLARRIICVSEAVVDCVKTFYPGSTNKYVLIRNGLPDIDREMHVYGKIRSEFDVPKSRILVAMVGRLHFWKGQDVLLKAVWLLSQRDIRIDVILFGDVFKGYEAFSAKLHSLATGYGIVDRVHFAGFRHDVTDLLIDSDIVTVPSTLPDPFPTVALEALRAAVPLILSSSSGAAEIVVDGESAILCTPNNAEDLAEKLAVLVTSPKLREKLSAGGRDVFERMLVMSEFQRNIRSAVDDLVGKSRT
jgi:glycosyltransferase involved in cell wall biosynthesis